MAQGTRATHQGDVTQRADELEFSKGLLAATPDAIVIVNRDDRIDLFDAQAERLVNYSRAQLLGESLGILVPAPSRDWHSRCCANFHAGPWVRGIGSSRESCGVRDAALSSGSSARVFPRDAVRAPSMLGSRSREGRR